MMARAAIGSLIPHKRSTKVKINQEKMTLQIVCEADVDTA